MKKKIINFLQKELINVSKENKEKVAHMILCLEENNFIELDRYSNSKKLKFELFEQSMFLKIKTFDECKRIIELKLYYENHLTNSCECKPNDNGYNETYKCCLTENCHHNHPKLIFKIINNKSLNTEHLDPNNTILRTKEILNR